MHHLTNISGIETFQDWNVSQINSKGDIITACPDVKGVMNRIVALARGRIYVILVIGDEQGKEEHHRFVAVSEDRIPAHYRETDLVLVPDEAAGMINVETRWKEGRKHPEEKPRSAAEIFGINDFKGLNIVAADGNYH